jgi:hypothetical protein
MFTGFIAYVWRKCRTDQEQVTYEVAQTTRVLENFFDDDSDGEFSNVPIYGSPTSDASNTKGHYGTRSRPNMVRTEPETLSYQAE